MTNDNRKLKTPEERQAALADAFSRIRPLVLEHKDNENTGVLARLNKVANNPANDETNNKDKSPKKKEPLTLAGLAKEGQHLDKTAKTAGVDIKAPTSKKKTQEAEKKQDNEKETSQGKQESKAQEMFSKVKLPSGMEIHQEGPQWVLVSQDGKQRTNITDVMNTIDKFNRDVDAANEQNRMQNAAQGSVDKAVDVNKKDEGLTINETSGKVKMVGEALPAVKDVNGEQLFKPEDIKAVAEIGIQASIEKGTLEKLKDPHSIEKLRDREKENERNADDRAREAQQMALRHQQDRGGR